MATTKRTAQIEIRVEDKSLRQLNDEIQRLETSMQDLKIGTEEWIATNKRIGDLRREFNNVTHAASELEGQVERIGSAEQLKSITNLGKGMVGAFSAAQGAMSLLGQTGNKTFDELTARGVQLLQVMNGLDAVAVLFEENTIKGLNAVGAGFNRLVLQVRSASLAMKSALIATGIGALAVGVGLLIANWEKLTNLLTGTDKAEEARLQRNLDRRNLIAEQEANRLNQMQERVKILEQEFQYTGDYAKLQKDLFELEQQRTIEVQARANAVDAELRQTERLYNEIISGRQTVKKEELLEIQAKLRALKAEKEILDVQIQQQEINEANAALRVKNADAQDEINKSIKRSEDRLIELNNTQFSTNAIYREQRNILQQQLREITSLRDLGTQLTQEQIEREKTLRVELSVMDLINKSFNERVQNERALLESERERNKQVGEYNQKVFELRDALREQERIERQRNSILDNNRRLLELDLRGLRDARDLRESIANFDREGNRLYKERTEELIPSEVRLTKQAYEEIKRFLGVFEDEKEYESFQFFADTLEEYVKSNRQAIIDALELGKEYEDLGERNKQLINDAAEDLALQRIESELITKSLKEQEKSLENQKEIYLENVDQYNITIAALEHEEEILQYIIHARQGELDALKANNAEVEEINAKTEEILGLENTLLQVQGERNTILEERKNTEDLIYEVNEDLLETKLNITNEEAKTNDLLREQTFSLKELFRVHQQLQDFVEKYRDEIGASMDLINSGVFLATSIIDRQIEMMDRRIADQQKKLDDLQQREDERQGRLLGYERELQDAGGERYDELINLMEEEKRLADQAALEKQNAEQELLKQEQKRLELERKSAIWRKSQAIIDATIQTILATIEALPNLLLSGIVAGAGAIGVAAIAAQPLPQKPQAARGGLIKGASHAQGGVDMELEGDEFVVNKYAVAKYYPIIKAMNDDGRRKMAEGGLVNDTPDMNMSNTSIIDYDVLAGKIAEAVSHLPSPQVSIMKIQSELNNVRVTKSQAGLRR